METKLRHLLRQRNITITQAAKELGIKRETLQRKLSGQYPFYLRSFSVRERGLLQGLRLAGRIMSDKYSYERIQKQAVRSRIRTEHRTYT